jgi:hypothetical protein
VLNPATHLIKGGTAMPDTPNLDHLERNGHYLRSELLEKLQPVTVMAIDGATADSIGSLALKELSAITGKPIIVSGPSDYHAGDIYHG